MEEIYYRRAVALGIDRNDEVIRRRLRQKMEFLTEDVAMIRGASEDELAAYLNDNQQRFRTAPTYTFRQIYFNPEKHGDAPADDGRRPAGSA